MHILLTGNTTFKLANFREGLIQNLISSGHKVTVVAPPDEYVDLVTEWGCTHMPLRMNRTSTAPVSELWLLGTIFKLVLSNRPDAVLSFTIKNNIYFGLVCRTLNVPFFPNVTGLGATFQDGHRLNRIVRLMYRSALCRSEDVFFQNTTDQGVFLGDNLIDPAKAVLLPGSGVDLDRFAPTPLPGSGEKMRFLMCSRMLYDKGVGVFCEAAHSVRQKIPGAQFSLLGPMDPGSKGGVSAQNLRLWTKNNGVDYLGATRDVRPFLDQADCVVLPSYYKEGTPRALIEAAAKGRPIITTDMPGCRDLVRSGSNGFLVAPRDPADLASAFIKFADLRQEHRAEMGRESRKLAEAHYDENIVISAYERALNGLGTTSLQTANA